MGIVCSGPSKNFITPTMNGENDTFREEVVVRISDEGFAPYNLTLYEGQCLLFEWKTDLPSQAFNVIQVSGAELNPVPGGYNSGDLTQAGSFKVCLGRKGQFLFVSESLPDKTLKVQVLEKPPTEVKITDRGFEPQFVTVQEGDVIQWGSENEDSEIPCYLQEMEYCFKHGGFISRKPRFEVKLMYQRRFQNTGLYFFYLEMCDADWGDSGEAILICVVKVTQKKREFSVCITEQGLQPNFISARVQDRIWLDCSCSQIDDSKVLDAYIYKDGITTSPLVTARMTSSLCSSSRIVADLVSHQFTEPGLYHYVYNMADLSQLKGCVVVQPKPTEHVINIDNGQFKPALGTVKQGERVWWALNGEEDVTMYLKELEHCTPIKALPSRRRSSNSGCGCRKVKHQAGLMNLLGLVTHKFDDIGVFTYWLQDDNGSLSSSNCCSVVVQKNAKHHTVKVCDQGFAPRILNVHPGDWVWWQWEGTGRLHNIVQVSHQRTLMPGGFNSGKPTCSVSAFTNIFTELGVIYFASNGLPEVFGAVVVTPESQVHKIHVTSRGIQPDPLVISANDCVSWMWFDGESFTVQEISQPEDAEVYSVPPPEGPGKRCYSRVFAKPGMYHFLCTAHHDDEDEAHGQRTDSFVHTVLVDSISYSCMVGVSADGFKPSTVTIAKSQSVLWTWEKQGSEEHNILHVRPPQDEQPLVRVRGLSAFDSGPVTTNSTFFHTFDVPGRYFITSEGTSGQLCTIDVLDNGVYVSPPKISDTERHGGNVECGYRVFLQCDTVDAEMLYTIDGSYPVDCNVKVSPYNQKKGIVLAQAGFVLIRAIAKKQGWVSSQVFTSKRFWVLEGDSELLEESGEEAEQYLETGSEEVDLKEQIFNWHWLSCRPSISVELVCDNTFNIDITLENAADVSWIKGFQLYLNGTSYGGWLSPQCRGLVISGLIGGKVYHVVLVVFATHESFEPQLSNEVVISCPVQSSSGGPLVSLEASSTPQSLVIVWPTHCHPRTTGVAAYSVFINGQPFGEQIVPEPGVDYCRVLFESSLEHEVYTLCVASHLAGADLILYSNEVEFSLPVPHEILSALQTPKDQEDSSGEDALDDGTPARELLLVAERVIPTLSEAEQSGIVKLSLKSIFKLQTIPEDRQLDVIVAETDVMEEDLLQSGHGTTVDGNTDPTPAETYSECESLGNVEGQNHAFGDEHFIAVANDSADRDATPDNTLHQASGDSAGENEAYSELVGELDAAIFKDFGELVSEKESLVKSQEVGVTESQLPIAERADEVELEKASNVEGDPLVVINGQNDDSTLKQPDELEVGSSNENSTLNQPGELGVGSSNETPQVPNQGDDSCRATVYEQPENVSNLDNRTEAYENDNNLDEQNVPEFWNQGEKQRDEDSIKDDDLTPKEENELSGHDTAGENNVESQITGDNAVPGHATVDNDAKGHVIQEEDVHGDETNEGNFPDNQENATKGEKEDFEDGNQHEHLEHVVNDVEGQEDETREKRKCLDTTDGVAPKMGEKTGDNSGNEDLSAGLAGLESVQDESARKLENSEESEADVDVLTEENTQVSQETRTVSSEHPTGGSGDNDDNNVHESTKRKLKHNADEKLQSENPGAMVAETVQESDKAQNNVSLAENDDTSPKETNDAEGRSDTVGERNGIFPSENVVCGGEQTQDRKADTEEPGIEDVGLREPFEKETESISGVVEIGDLTDKTSGDSTMGKEKPMKDELLEETWSASSSCGSVKNDEDKTNGVETTEMPTFEEGNLGVEAVSLPRGSMEDDEDRTLDRDNENPNSEAEGYRADEKETIQGLDVSHEESIQDECDQLLPRPLLVIKGTTPTTVTLEWEWMLLPEQIAGSDIVYSMLILGSKFHSNINSSFCFNFEESPAKAMWPKQSNNLRQHAWRTTNTVIEITGLKQRCNYRLAVLGQLMPFANDSLSHVIPFTMPGPPKPPVVHVTDLKDREVTLSWKPPASFGEATVVGYRVLKDGKAFGGDLDCETLILSISGLEEGEHHRFTMMALTSHSVGDSKKSNTITIHCPTPPITPQIYQKDSATVGSICIAWKQAEPSNNYNSEEHVQCSYSVFVDGMLHGEYPLDGLTDIFTDEHTYMIPNCEVGRKYEVCVKSYLNPRVIDTGRGKHVHVCGCYGDSSNILELFCAGPPSPPVVGVSRIDQSGVTLSWSRSREYGEVTLGGYILYVNGRWSGEILPPEQLQTKLTGFNPGDAMTVQLAAITNDLPASISAFINQEGAKSRYFPSQYEQPDSGVESSSSFLSKGPADETKQYACSAGPPLVIQYSNLVRTVSSLDVIKLGYTSASITWLLDDTADRSVEPEILSVLHWKTTEEEKSASKQIVTEKPFKISHLEPATEYHVQLQCVAPHLNDNNYEEHPINLAQSQTISFKTGSAPGPPSNIYVDSATEHSIKFTWEAPIEHVVPVAAIHVSARKAGQSMHDEGVNFQVSRDTCAFTFDCLDPKTEYTFVLKALTENDLDEMPDENAGSVACFSAWTNGIEPAENLNLQSRSPTSIAIKWEPAMAYGMSAIQRYVVHYVQNRQLRKRSRGRAGHEKEVGKEVAVDSECSQVELHGLEPGTVYRIVVETVAAVTDYSYDEDFESEDSDANSAVSSALSEKIPEIQRLHLSQPLLVCTSVPPEPPVLMVSGFTSTQIHLSWNKPLLLKPVVDSQCPSGEDPARGRVRHLKGFRVEVNGRVFARLAANKTSVTLKKCKSGMKYTCVVVVITGPEKQHSSQRKNETPDTAISDTDADTDEDVTKSLSDCSEEAASDPVEVTLPRQEWGVSLTAKYCANKPAGSLWDSPCSENGDEEGGVVVRWNINELSGEVRGYRLVWYGSECRERNEVSLPRDVDGYEIWTVSPSTVYTVYLEILDMHEEAVAVFGPLHCQTPGPPASPWIWCRTLSPYQFTIEWNEPVAYGDVNIRAYQVHLNDRRLEKLVDRRQRRVTIHCQSSSVYRISVVALGSDPQYGDSAQSNVLKLCTPVAQDVNMGRRPSGGIKRPAFDISVHLLSTENTRISFEWTCPPEIVAVDTADHYVIKWSSVLKPQIQELTLPLGQTNHVIEDCIPGTRHFLVVAAVNNGGDLVSRSEQHTVQSSAPVEQPVLHLRSCYQPAIIFDWRKPTIFGDAAIDYYQLMVNDEVETDLEAECSYFKFTSCEPCEQYTFRLKAVSTKSDCDSIWSEPLVVTCPGAERPLVTRIQSKQINCIRVGWEKPLLRGDARVENFKVYYLEDRGHIMTSDDVIAEAQAVQHGPLPWYTEEDKLVPVPPDSYYWVVLQVELSPDDCQPVYSQPIRTRAAVSPDPPLIRLEVEGVAARQRLEERICELSIRRDRLHRVVHLLESSVVVKGSKLKDLQIDKATDTMLEVDSELADALEDIKEYTGSISALISWPRPRDDGDATVSGYQVFVDGKRHGEPLTQSALETRVKLPVTRHVIAVQTLSDHPVGPSPLSNPVEPSGHEFLPFVMFCYFDVHKRGESWPKTGCCSWDDSHSYELKHRGKTAGRVFVPRGFLARRIPCPVFNVMDVFSASWKPVAPAGVNKMVAVLFWTKWCFSSQKVLEYFLKFAEEFADKFSLVTCCVRSEEPVTSHRQSLAGLLTERGWRQTTDSVTHTCGCYPQSQRSRSARRGVISDPDVCQLFGLVGVPTIFLLDKSGYISWHGRCSCQDAPSFRTSLLHAFSQVSQSLCPVPSCLHCELDKEDERDTALAEVDENDEYSSGRHRKPSFELNSLYQRLHGSSLKDDSFSSPRTFTHQGEIKKEQVRPKTTSAAGRSARLAGYNRFSGLGEQYTLYSRSFSAFGAAHPSRPVAARPASVVVRSRTRTPQSTQSAPHSSSGDVSLPAMTRQRGKRTHPQERGSAPRFKTKISVEDFTLK